MLTVTIIKDFNKCYWMFNI